MSALAFILILFSWPTSGAGAGGRSWANWRRNACRSSRLDPSSLTLVDSERFLVCVELRLSVIGFISGNVMLIPFKASDHNWTHLQYSVQLLSDLSEDEFRLIQGEVHRFWCRGVHTLWRRTWKQLINYYWSQSKHHVYLSDFVLTFECSILQTFFMSCPVRFVRHTTTQTINDNISKPYSAFLKSTINK